jgi:hypothetical protein
MSVEYEQQNRKAYQAQRRLDLTVVADSAANTARDVRG